MPHDTAADVFTIPDFWRASSLLKQPGQATSFFYPQLDATVTSTLKPPPSPAPVSVSVPVQRRETTPPLSNDDDGFFKLPSVLLGALSIDTPGEAKPAEAVVPIQDASDVAPIPSPAPDDDLWLSPELGLEHGTERPEYRTWSSFDSTRDKRSGPVVPVFMSESSPEVYDAFLASEDNPLGLPANSDYSIFKPRDYCACLLSLALGRGSLLFAFDTRKKSFVPTVDFVKVPGYSGRVLQGVEGVCLEAGNAIHSLKSFVEKTYAAHSTASRVALANAVDKLLLTVQRELGVRGQKARSLLQLQAVVRPVRTLLRYFRDLVAKLSRIKSDEECLSVLFAEAQSLENSEGFMRDAIREVLKSVSTPWMDFVNEWMGLDPAAKSTLLSNGHLNKGFVRLGNRVWVDDMGIELEEPDYFLDDEKMPAFIPSDLAQSLFETGRNLRFLHANHPEHPLSNPATFEKAEPPRLQWLFDWDSIAAVERKALAYEAALSRAIQEATTVKSQIPSEAEVKPRAESKPSAGYLSNTELRFFGKDDDQMEEVVLASIAELDQPVAEKSVEEEEDGLTKVLRNELFRDSSSDVAAASTAEHFTPHWSLLPLLSLGPVVTAQARLVNRECMRLLFSAHGLREHLALQRDFQLLGNGLFCSRLSHALFDPDLAAAERRGGAGAGDLGLRLSARETWPPASSELRLALMGVLAESYEPRYASAADAAAHDAGRGGKKHELPGDMSFAVRDLSPDEMERCMDPDSLEALDFLRLSYKPPSPLMSVITPAVLVKYDRVFRLLLRMLRMLYVVNRLFRDVAPGEGSAGGSRADKASSARFRIEAHHFVSCVMAHFFDTGIAAPWRRFEAWLDGVQAALEEQEAPPSRRHQQQHFGPDRLCEYHEQVLDEVMQVLFLRKRQQPVLRLLQDIFAVILRFAKAARQRRASSRAGGEGAEEDAPTANVPGERELYASFRKKVEVFVTVCRSLSEKGGGGGSRAIGGDGERRTDGEEDAVARLLLMLDLTGYYHASSSR